MCCGHKARRQTRRGGESKQPAVTYTIFVYCAGLFAQHQPCLVSWESRSMWILKEGSLMWHGTNWISCCSTSATGRVQRRDVHNRMSRERIQIKWQIVRKLLADLHNLLMGSTDFGVLNAQLSALCNWPQGGAQVDWVICQSPVWAWIVNLPPLISRRKETHFCQLLLVLGYSWNNLKITPSASWGEKNVRV